MLMKEIKKLNKRKDILCSWNEKQHSKSVNLPQIGI